MPKQLAQNLQDKEQKSKDCFESCSQISEKCDTVIEKIRTKRRKRNENE